ncbi:sugar ABC transporter permease [Clostridium disporicum]|jgi:arabinogalactan oligomer/maltooligosaccharide transport system permease protein|uniref:Maltose:maltodextrin transport system permease n=1 Tax=Clostridium disporicum TaxID=84024 RepID=A0A174K247_9CLOT|nr:ABC transporter permease subunit [Clostridium disporicum]CUP06144.1 maltose:maltodextrin transport system permease [Clostridium disporicum]
MLETNNVKQKSSLKKKKKSNLYLSDKQPLTLGGKIALGISYVFLIGWALAVIWPILQIIISSFNGEQGKRLNLNAGFSFSLKHFQHLFENTMYLKWMGNTIFISVVTAILVVLIVSFTGYAYSRYRFKGKKVSLMTIMLIQTIPQFVGITAYFTMYSIASDMVPAFTRQMMLILIYAGTGIAGNTIILKGYLDSISTELDDAAKIDGCSSMKIYRLIIMPIARPMLAIIALWSFIGPFMDVLLSKVLLTTPADYTLSVGLYTLVNDERTINQPAFAAGALLAAVPIVILFIALQKQLVSGLSNGATKG